MKLSEILNEDVSAYDIKRGNVAYQKKPTIHSSLPVKREEPQQQQSSSSAKFKQPPIIDADFEEIKNNWEEIKDNLNGQTPIQKLSYCFRVLAWKVLEVNGFPNEIIKQEMKKIAREMGEVISQNLLRLKKELSSMSSSMSNPTTKPQKLLPNYH